MQWTATYVQLTFTTKLTHLAHIHLIWIGMYVCVCNNRRRSLITNEQMVDFYAAWYVYIIIAVYCTLCSLISYSKESYMPAVWSFVGNISAIQFKEHCKRSILGANYLIIFLVYSVYVIYLYDLFNILLSLWVNFGSTEFIMYTAI